jgi:methylmalonyl-CoA mutase
VPFVDASLYVMTPEFGAASQLEKIDMLDFADFVAINKFDRKGAEDALRDVRKQYQRNRQLFAQKPDEMPIYGTQASRFNDDGVTALYQALAAASSPGGVEAREGASAPVRSRRRRRTTRSSRRSACATSPTSPAVRGYHKQAVASRRASRASASREDREGALRAARQARGRLRPLIAAKEGELLPAARKLLEMWPKTRELYSKDDYVVKIRDREIRTRLIHETLSGTHVRKVALPRFQDEGEILAFLMRENLPGPSRSPPACSRSSARPRIPRACSRARVTPSAPIAVQARLRGHARASPLDAFDSVTLYGFDPDKRPTSTGRSATRACRSPRSTT